MPPSAMRRSVKVPMWRACRSGSGACALARQSRSNRSRLCGCGNLGAAPKPPSRLSKECASCARQALSGSSVSSVSAAAAVLCQHLLRNLVDAIDVRPLLAVHLDVDEVLVEKPCGGFVFEALVGRDVAPMTGVVSHAQVNRLFLGARPLECFIAPRIPLDGIVSMLPQVWARLSREMVRVLRRAVAVEVADFHPDLQSRLYTRPCPSSVPDSCRTPVPPTSSPLRASCASSAAKSG